MENFWNGIMKHIRIKSVKNKRRTFWRNKSCKQCHLVPRLTKPPVFLSGKRVVFALVEAPAPSPVRTAIVLGNTEISVAARLQIAVVGQKEYRRPTGRRFVLCMQFGVQSFYSSYCASNISTWVPAKLSKRASWDFCANSFCRSASGHNS